MWHLKKKQQLKLKHIQSSEGPYWVWMLFDFTHSFLSSFHLRFCFTVQMYCPPALYEFIPVDQRFLNGIHTLCLKACILY